MGDGTEKPDRVLVDCMTCRHRFHIRRAVASMVTVCPKCKHFVVPWEREVKPVEWIGPGAPKQRQAWRGTIPKPPPPPGAAAAARTAAGAPPLAPQPIVAEVVPEAEATAAARCEMTMDRMVAELFVYAETLDRPEPSPWLDTWQGAGTQSLGIFLALAVVCAVLGPCGILLFCLGLFGYACWLLVRMIDRYQTVQRNRRLIYERGLELAEQYAKLPDDEAGGEVDFIP